MGECLPTGVAGGNRGEADALAVEGGDGRRRAGFSEAKIAILEGLIRDQSLTPADRLRAIEAHTKFTEADEDAMTRPDPATLCDWLCNGTERDGKTEKLLCDVFRMLDEIWRITPEQLVGIAVSWASQRPAAVPDQGARE